MSAVLAFGCQADPSPSDSTDLAQKSGGALVGDTQTSWVCQVCSANADCPKGSLCITPSSGGPAVCLPTCNARSHGCPADFGCVAGPGRDHCEPLQGTCCTDGDRDGYGTGALCKMPDCDDTDPAVHPGAQERCNGRDDDCDGVVDNGNPGGGGACNAGQSGTCGAGTLVCTGGALACVPNSPATPELCNGVDDNCNGLVDEGNPGGGQACTTSLPGVCAAGTTTCTGGALVCTQNQAPSAEVCNLLDDDCNGKVDDGFPDITCGVGACQRTVSSCTLGVPQTCTPGQPSAEICDGIDNDCDGIVDNGNPGGGVACSTGQRGACAAGVTACQAGALTCVQSQAPSAEICDGIDNDCDGVVDNGNPGGGASCNTGLPGVCAAGATQCTGGALSCVAITGPSPEQCDGLDNDCDGVVDNGVGTRVFRDADGDGHGDATVTLAACAAPPGYVSSSDDCDDGDARAFPGQTAFFNDRPRANGTWDFNCDGVQEPQHTASTFTCNGGSTGCSNNGGYWMDSVPTCGQAAYTVSDIACPSVCSPSCFFYCSYSPGPMVAESCR
jgi:hypothetical protein